MNQPKESNKAPNKKLKKQETSKVNDIIQKIVDAHAAVDQTLAEISESCSASRDCKGK